MRVAEPRLVDVTLNATTRIVLDQSPFEVWWPRVATPKGGMAEDGHRLAQEAKWSVESQLTGSRESS